MTKTKATSPVGIFVADSGDILVLKHITDVTWGRLKVKCYIHNVSGNHTYELGDKEAERFQSELITYYELLERPEQPSEPSDIKTAQVQHRVRDANKEEKNLDCCSDRVMVYVEYSCSCGIKACTSCIKDHIFNLHLG